jgi:hypothetical protein
MAVRIFDEKEVGAVHREITQADVLSVTSEVPTNASDASFRTFHKMYRTAVSY